MKKKILIVCSSLRKNSNSDILSEWFASGAAKAGHSIDRISLKEIDLKFCNGCMACLHGGKCAIDDGMNALYDRVSKSDVLVFATPIYYYGMAGQLKTFLDRLNPIYPKKNSFKEVYLLATAADTDESAMDGAITGVQGFIDCFSGVKLMGVVKGVGMDGAGAIANSDILNVAYEMGKGV